MASKLCGYAIKSAENKKERQCIYALQIKNTQKILQLKRINKHNKKRGILNKYTFYFYILYIKELVMFRQ